MNAPLVGVLHEIAKVAGEAAAVALAAQVGGNRVYIPLPVNLHDRHWLVECVGRRAAEKIAAHYAGASAGARTGTYIDVPLGAGGAYPQLRRAIAKRVHELDKAGKSAREITRAAGITARTVHRHRAAHRGRKKSNSKQGSLF